MTAQDSSAISATITLGSSTTAPGGTNAGSGTGVAGAASLNDVRGGATASITSATLTATGGNVLVQAKEMATLTATTTSEVSTGSSSTPTTTAGSTTKSPLAIDGLIGTNLVQSAATATLSHSQVTAAGTGTGVGGVTVNAQNTATLTAMTTNAATASTSTSGSGGGSSGGGGSGNVAVGVTLAFNTIGWESENVLFSAIDALLGDSLLAGAVRGENPSNATATMLDTTVIATGQLTVSAVDATTITSTIGNTTTASTSGGTGGTGTTSGQKGSQNLALGFVLASNKVLGSAQATIGFDTGNLAASTIQAAGGVSVTAQDSSGISATITLGSSSTAPGGSNSGGSTGVAGAVSLNDVRGGATASITNTTLTASGGNVLVQAEEMATLTATTTSEVTAGSSSTPTTTSGSTTKSPLAIDGLIGTNLVQSAATATLGSSHVTTTGAGAGAVTVAAQNTAKLTAMTTNAATASSSSGAGGGGGSGGSGGSGNTAVGVTLAFNTIGWESQNVLFNAIDALLGSPTLANAFGGENPSDATATMLDTTVSITGELTVGAVDSPTITSTITNTSKANSTGLMGASGTAVAVVLSMNKVASAAQASINFDSSFVPPASGADIQAAGGVAVTARDTSTISSTLILNAAVTSGGVGGGGGQQSTKSIAVAGAVAYNDVDGGASASLTSATVNASGGNVMVSAQEAANLTATMNVVADTSGQTFGSGNSSSLAVGGLISTNVVRSAATALLGSSSVTTTSGNVGVVAANTPTITATLTNEVTEPSGSSTGLAITLAFNSIGWQGRTSCSTPSMPC